MVSLPTLTIPGFYEDDSILRGETKDQPLFPGERGTSSSLLFREARSSRAPRGIPGRGRPAFPPAPGPTCPGPARPGGSEAGSQLGGEAAPPLAVSARAPIAPHPAGPAAVSASATAGNSRGSAPPPLPQRKSTNAAPGPRQRERAAPGRREAVPPPDREGRREGGLQIPACKRPSQAPREARPRAGSARPWVGPPPLPSGLKAAAGRPSHLERSHRMTELLQLEGTSRDHPGQTPCQGSATTNRCYINVSRQQNKQCSAARCSGLHLDRVTTRCHSPAAAVELGFTPQTAFIAPVREEHHTPPAPSIVFGKVFVS
ncbi:atherin-like [Parus major]|uniref:atherin-like n=1 Tax=Parus major TaxID=9157 RepID=UPI00077140BB|nr:atherin-like [Parus major]